MPPKPSDKKKKKIPDLILGKTNITKLSQLQLIEYLLREARELHEVKKKRSFGEQERDITFRKLEIVREEIEKSQDEVIVRANKMEAKELNQHAELKVHRQRANHLKYELDRDLVKARADQAVFLAENSKAHADALNDISLQHIDLTAKTMDERKAYEQNTKEVMALAERQYVKAKENYLTALTDRSEDLDLEMDDIDELSSLDIRNYQNLLDQQRLEHISNLKKNFERNYHEIKHYFQELTYHNLTMIQDLTRQGDAIKGHFSDLHKRYREIQRETEQNREPLKVQSGRLAEHKKQADTHRKEKYSLNRLRRSVEKLEAERSNLQSAIKKYDMDYKEIQIRHKELRASFAPAIMEAKQIIGSDATMVREKACSMRGQVEQLKASLRERSETNQDAAADEHLRHLELIERRYYTNTTTQRDLEFELQ